MATRTLTTIALLAFFVLPVIAKDKEATPGNPPAILIASKIDAQGNLVLVSFRTIFIQPASPTSGGGRL